jgi:hypothetical protein
MTTLHGCMMRIHPSQGMTLRFLRLLSSRLPNPSNDDEDESHEEIRVSNCYNFRKNPKRKVLVSYCIRILSGLVINWFYNPMYIDTVPYNLRYLGTLRYLFISFCVRILRKLVNQDTKYRSRYFCENVPGSSNINRKSGYKVP